MIRGARWRRDVGAASRYAILSVVAVMVLLPIYWVIASSLKSAPNIEKFPPQWIPEPLTLSSYIQAFQQVPVARFFLNSIVIGLMTVVGNLLFCSTAGYVLAKFRFKGRGFIFLLAVVSMMIPAAVRLIPNYVVMQNLGLVNTYPGIALPVVVTGFGIFLMRQYFITLPSDVEDAARMDGCSEWGVLFRVVLPVSRPAIASLAIFSAIWSLDDFLWPLIVTTSVTMRPLPLGIALFLNAEYVNWGPVMALTTMTMIPVLIVYVALQRQFIRGLTAGAVTG